MEGRRRAILVEWRTRWPSLLHRSLCVCACEREGAVERVDWVDVRREKCSASIQKEMGGSVESGVFNERIVYLYWPFSVFGCSWQTLLSLPSSNASVGLLIAYLWSAGWIWTCKCQLSLESNTDAEFQRLWVLSSRHENQQICRRQQPHTHTHGH